MIALFITVLAVIAATYQRQTLSSALIKYSSFVEIQKNVFVSSNTTDNEKKELINLIKQSQQRINNKLGEYTATTIIISSNDTEKLKPYISNNYGATHFTLSNAYIIIGPKGLNVDVISHEFVHAEIFNRLGYLNRWAKVPVWFDEGIAMQVDTRKRYNNPINNSDIKTLTYGWQFFRGDITNHYALSKKEVANWLSESGSNATFFKLLNKINHGHNFNDIYFKLGKGNNENE